MISRLDARNRHASLNEIIKDFIKKYPVMLDPKLSYAEYKDSLREKDDNYSPENFLEIDNREGPVGDLFQSIIHANLDRLKSDLFNLIKERNGSIVTYCSGVFINRKDKISWQVSEEFIHIDTEKSNIIIRKKDNVIDYDDTKRYYLSVVITDFIYRNIKRGVFKNG